MLDNPWVLYASVLSLFSFFLRNYWVESGIVTGGQYDSHKGCEPYEVKACDHHVKGHLKPCGGIVPTPPCKKKCEAGMCSC